MKVGYVAIESMQRESSIGTTLHGPDVVQATRYTERNPNVLRISVSPPIRNDRRNEFGRLNPDFARGQRSPPEKLEQKEKKL